MYYVVEDSVGLEMTMKLDVHDFGTDRMYSAISIIERIEVTKGRKFPGKRIYLVGAAGYDPD